MPHGISARRPAQAEQAWLASRGKALRALQEEIGGASPLGDVRGITRPIASDAAPMTLRDCGVCRDLPLRDLQRLQREQLPALFCPEVGRALDGAAQAAAQGAAQAVSRAQAQEQQATLSKQASADWVKVQPRPKATAEQSTAQQKRCARQPGAVVTNSSGAIGIASKRSSRQTSGRLGGARGGALSLVVRPRSASNECSW